MMRERLIRISVLNLFLFFSTGVFADLVLSEGGPSGQWFNPERNGEGFYVEIIDASPMQIGVAMYSYDANGDPLWVVGNVAIDNDDEIVEIPVFEFNGPVWGPGYDPDDLNTIPFGTITANFPTCDTALFSIETNGALADGNYSLIRITSVEGVGCNEPPDPPTGTPTGLWTGPGVCFMVSPDGKSIVGGEGSGCDAQAAFDSNLEGFTNQGEGEECNVNASCEGVWPIVDGTFTCLNDLGEIATGTIHSATSASGFAIDNDTGQLEFCRASWTASPN